MLYSQCVRIPLPKTLDEISILIALRDHIAFAIETRRALFSLSLFLPNKIPEFEEFDEIEKGA